MQRNSAATYHATSTHHYVCNTLLNNPIILMGEPEMAEAGLQEFTLFRAKDINMFGLGDDILGLVPKQSNFYAMVQGPEIMAFMAFYLPYANDECIQTNVPSGAQIIITPNLSGCSFVGELNSPTPRIAHINRLQNDETDPLAMEQDIRNIIQDRSNYFIVRKNDYYDVQGDSMTLVFGLKLENKWQFTCQTVADNRVTQLITSFPIKTLLREQESRLRLIKLRNKIYHHLMKNDGVYIKENFGNDIIFSAKNINASLQAYHFWVPDYIQKQLKIIEKAQTGQLSWSRAEQMLRFMQLKYTTTQRPAQSVSSAAATFFSSQEHRQYRNSTFTPKKRMA